MKGRVIIESDLCKGCGVCIPACPNRCLALGEEINAIGYRYARFADGASCTACGLCFYVCPEPGAVRVIRSKGKEGQDGQAPDEGK